MSRFCKKMKYPISHCDSWSVVLCFMSSRSVFLCIFCVYSPCSVNWNGCARRLDARVTIMWLARQLICSEKRALQNASWTSMRLHRSNTAVCWNWGNVLRFGRKNRNQRLWKSLSLRTSSLRTLSSFERRWTCWRRERFVWRDVVPAGTREVRLVFVWNLCVTQETVDNTRVQPVARGDRDFVPVCSS